jgi:hypothetical protein
LGVLLLRVEPHYPVVEHRTATEFVLNFRCLHHLLWLYPFEACLGEKGDIIMHGEIPTGTEKTSCETRESQTRYKTDSDGGKSHVEKIQNKVDNTLSSKDTQTSFGRNADSRFPTDVSRKNMDYVGERAFGDMSAELNTFLQSTRVDKERKLSICTDPVTGAQTEVAVFLQHSETEKPFQAELRVDQNGITEIVLPEPKEYILRLVFTRKNTEKVREGYQARGTFGVFPRMIQENGGEIPLTVARTKITSDGENRYTEITSDGENRYVELLDIPSDESVVERAKTRNIPSLAEAVKKLGMDPAGTVEIMEWNYNPWHATDIPQDRQTDLLLAKPGDGTLAVGILQWYEKYLSRGFGHGSSETVTGITREAPSRLSWKS